MISDQERTLHQLLEARIAFETGLGLRDVFMKRPTAEESSSAAAGAGLSAQDADRLAQTAAEASACRKCELSESRGQVVFGAGCPQADLVFVGEAPGYYEDQQGLPFVGEAGALLTRMIEAMGLTREQVYICNVLKCRPPGNRDPRAEEIAACGSFLHRQLDAIKPKVVVALGAFAARTLLEAPPSTSMGGLRGRWHTYRGIDLMVTYHPAYLLRSPQFKRKAWSDLLMVCERLGLAPVKVR